MKKDVLESKVVFDGDFIKVHVDKIQLPNGNTIDKETVDRINGVRIVPIKQHKILVLEQQLLMRV